MVGRTEAVVAGPARRYRRRPEYLTVAAAIDITGKTWHRLTAYAGRIAMAVGIGFFSAVAATPSPSNRSK
jgi:hypothetical protein